MQTNQATRRHTRRNTRRRRALPAARLAHRHIAMLALVLGAGCADSDGAMGDSAMSKGAMGNGAMSNGAMGNSAMSNGAMGNGAMSNGAMSNSAMSNSAMSDSAMSDSTMSDSTMSDSTTTLDVSGTLEPQERALLRAELSGAVRVLSAKVGESVRAGTVLATLDVPAVRAAMAAAEAQVKSQEVALQQIQRERTRVAQLLSAGGVSRAEMDEWDARVEATDAALQAARAQLASAQADVARLTVRAPFSGIVERRMTTQGSVVQAGDELLSIIDPSTLELEAGVPAARTRDARPGTPVALRVAGWGDSTVTARIVRVAPALDPVTRQLRVTVRVPNTSRRLPAGAWAEGALMTASGTATTTATKKATTVSKTATNITTPTTTSTTGAR